MNQSAPDLTRILGVPIPGKMTLEKSAKYLGGDYHSLVRFKGDYFEILKSFRSRPEASGGRSGNADMFNTQVYSEENTSWKAGTFDDLMEESQDFSVYDGVRKKLSQSALWSKIVTKFNEVNARKRKRNAYDGEYDHDKRWDAEPFTKREAAKTQARIVKLKVEAGFSSSVSPERIAEFAAFIAAITNMLEQNGVLCEIIACKTGLGFVGGYGSNSNIYHMELRVKDADEYLPVQSIMKVFSPNWYRRISFGLIVCAAEVAGDSVDGGLGRPYEFGKCWDSEGDTINIYSVPDYTQQNNILDHLVAHLSKDLESKIGS